MQEWVQQAATESSDFQRKLWKEKTLEALARAKEEGVTIYEVDIAAFAAKVAPLLNNVENKQVRELLQEIAAVE